jgi:hypothetical protein
MDRSAAAIVDIDVTTVVISIGCGAGKRYALRRPCFANAVFADPAIPLACGGAIQRSAASITDGSTVVGNTARVVATGQGHASIEVGLCVRAAGGIWNLRRVRGRIRHSAVSDSCVGNASIDVGVRVRAAVGAWVHAAVHPACEINDSCIGKASIELRSRGRARIFLTGPAGFELANDHVGCGSRSARVRRAAFHVRSDRIGNRRAAIQAVAGNDPESVPAAAKQAGQQNRCPAAQATDCRLARHAPKFTPIPLFRVFFTRTRPSRNCGPKLPLAPGAQAR